MPEKLQKLHVSNPMINWFTVIGKNADENSTCFSNLQFNLNDLDCMTGGMETGLTVIAGRPGVCKTALGLHIFTNLCLKDSKSCLFFTLESKGESISKRIVSNLTGIDLLKIQSGHLTEIDFERILKATEILNGSNMYIDDSAITIDDIEYTVGAKLEFTPDFIVLDSLQMLENHNPKTTRYRNLNEIILRLKKLAFQYDCPVLVTSQLHKRLEMRADKRPLCWDFAETEMPYHAADKVLFLYRDEMYNENTHDRGTVEIICAKNKTGPIGKVRVKYIPGIGRFEDIRRE